MENRTPHTAPARITPPSEKHHANAKRMGDWHQCQQQAQANGTTSLHQQRISTIIQRDNAHDGRIVDARKRWPQP